MYQVLHDSKITLNQHIDLEDYANNMRLYEATGVGTMLITDYKQNLGDMFKLGRAVITYKTPEECAEVVDYYLTHDAEARRWRELASDIHSRHNYLVRMQELVEIIRKYLS